MGSRVAVIGAGYAGLAAAVELAATGIPVDVFEASRTLGGRARAIELDASLTVDNGAHIMVGAYRETLRLMQKVGAGESALQRRPLQLEFPGQMKLEAPRWPAPLHLAWALLTAQGLAFGEKLAAIRFMRHQKTRNFRLAADMTAAALFDQEHQPQLVRRYLWEPLCLAALNTPVAIASAQVFLNVLRDSLAADRAASDLLLPLCDFSRLFPEPAAEFLARHAGRTFRSTRVAALAKVGAGWTVVARETHGPYPHLILAVAPYHLQRLLKPHAEFAPLCRQLARLDWQPIVTAYLKYRHGTRLPAPMLGLGEGPAQWLFDRGALCNQPGLVAAVISGDGPYQALDRDSLVLAIHRQIAGLLPGLGLPEQSRVIDEKRATFACTPDLERPETATACGNVWLAGDYVAGEYPATLEGAVRSGIAAAARVGKALTAS